MFGTILHRMIFGELVRVFTLALISLTGLFLLGGLVSEATQRGLSPGQVLMIIPMLVPNTLPYTVPATCLFAACVVYGRLSHDNEITAVKAAGVHLGRLVAPGVLLGLLMAAGTLAMYYEFIPETHQVLRTQVLGDVEDLLYTLLKKQGCIRHPKMPYAIWVRQVQGRRLIDAIFKQKVEKGDGYKFVARAREAQIHFDTARNVIRVDMSYVTTFGENNQFTGNATDQTYEVELPNGVFGSDYVRRASDMAFPELLDRREVVQVELQEAIANAVDPVPPAHLTAPQKEQWVTAMKNIPGVKRREMNAIDAEIQMRPALAVGCLCFVLIGAPVGIWFSRADYLSTFVSCFLPTVIVYYPMLLCGTNMAKDGKLPAVLGLWAANAVVGIAGLILYARLLRR
jgi:lipopolysaccharide export system permease protein